MIQKSYQNDAKMDPKWNPTFSQNDPKETKGSQTDAKRTKKPEKICPPKSKKRRQTTYWGGVGWAECAWPAQRLTEDYKDCNAYFATGRGVPHSWRPLAGARRIEPAERESRRTPKVRTFPQNKRRAQNQI